MQGGRLVAGNMEKARALVEAHLNAKAAAVATEAERGGADENMDEDMENDPECHDESHLNGRLRP